MKIAYPELPEKAGLDPKLEKAGVKQINGDSSPPNYNKEDVLNHIRNLVISFSSLRQNGEAVGVGASVLQGTTVTAAGIVAGVTAGGVTVAGAALAFPLTAAIGAIAVIAGIILRQKALNEELRVNLIMIKGEVERLYNIYKVIEEIAKEKDLPINTEMVGKFTIILSNNILLVAGPETFEMIKKMSEENGDAFFQPESALGLKTLNKGQIKTHRESWWNFGVGLFKRTIVPMEVLRTLVRDITILTVFFTILQSEFDLLSREKEEQDRTALFKAIGTDSGIKFQPNTVKAFENYYKSNNWINSEVYKRFKAQLPKNNLNIAINNSTEGMKNHGTIPDDVSNPGTPTTPKTSTGGRRTGRRNTLKTRQSKRKTRSRK